MDMRKLYAQNILVFYSEKKIGIQTVNHIHNTRNEHKIYLPRAKKAIGQRYFAYIAPRLINIIPDALKSYMHSRPFKKKLKKWLISSERHTIYAIIFPENI